MTGVCGTTKVDLVRSLGADHVIDYTREDFADGTRRYDLILDNAGTATAVAAAPRPAPQRDPRHRRRRRRQPLVGRVRSADSAGAAAVALRGPELWSLNAKVTAGDLEVLTGAHRGGRVKPIVDRTYPLAQVAEAIRYLHDGRARGKVVVNVAEVAGGGAAERSA